MGEYYENLSKINVLFCYFVFGTTAQNKLIQPTNGKIAYHSRQNNISQIYTMNPDGSNKTKLTNTTAFNQLPSFSPDGMKIVFSSGRDGDQEIYIMNADGSDQRRLTNNIGDDFHATFSPDGSKIAYSRFVEPTPPGGNFEIFIMNVDGSNQIRLTNTPGRELKPAFSPDGTKIAFDSDRDGDFEIYVMNLDGSNQTKLTNNTFNDFNPAFSPQGKIGFERFPSTNGDTGLYIMNDDGTNQTAITPSVMGTAMAFSPDGTKLVFSTRVINSLRIATINLDGSNFTILTSGLEEDYGATWGQAPPCIYTTTPTSVNISSIGGTISFNIQSDFGCPWTATNNNSWISIISGTNGIGNGSVSLSIQPNISDARTGTIIVGGQTFTVNQVSGCSYSINPTSIQAGAGAGDTGFNITTETGCNWTAQSNANWITVSNPMSSGVGRINYSIQPNTSTTARTGTITVGGQTFTVNQDAVAAPIELINVRGRVMSRNNKPVRGAVVTFFNTRTGETQTAVSNPFGYFHFKNIERGQIHSVGISHKRYKFSDNYAVSYNLNNFVPTFVADQE